MDEIFKVHFDQFEMDSWMDISTPLMYFQMKKKKKLKSKREAPFF